MSDTASNTEEVRRAVTAAILEAVETAILLRFQSLDTADISTKSGPNDFVTIADQEAEEILSARLRTIRSDAAVVGEEAAAEDPDILTRLRRPGAAWVIDPIDGTGNFVAGQDAFAVVVALVEDGKTQMGWTHHPLSGDTIWAAVGEGVWQGAEQLGLLSAPSQDIWNAVRALADEDYV